MLGTLVLVLTAAASSVVPDVAPLLPNVYTEHRRITLGQMTETLHYACTDPEEPTTLSEHDTLLGAARDFGTFARCCTDASRLPLDDLGTALRVIDHDRTQPLKAPVRDLATMPATLHRDLERLATLLDPAAAELDALARRHARRHGPELLGLLATTRDMTASDTLYIHDDNRSLRLLIRDITGRSFYGLPLTLTQAEELDFFTKCRNALTSLTLAAECDRRTGPSLLVWHASLRSALFTVNPVYAHALEHYALMPDTFLLPGNLLPLIHIASGAHILELTPGQVLALEDPSLREILVTLLRDDELSHDVMFEVACSL